MRRRVLLVEDDAPLRAAINVTLTGAGLEVTEAASGEEALARLGMAGADLVVLDLTLPGIDGMQALTRLRHDSDVPVVVLTVRASLDDKLGALDAGADDYVTKPFDSDELVARVHAALRRSSGVSPPSDVVVAGDLEIDRGQQTVRRNGTEIRLTPTEWALLDLLVRHVGRLVRYDTITDEIRVRSGELDRAGTRVFVARLRKKLGDDATDPRLILTQFGLGVRWIGSPVQPPSGGTDGPTHARPGRGSAGTGRWTGDALGGRGGT